MHASPAILDLDCDTDLAPLPGAPAPRTRTRSRLVARAVIALAGLAVAGAALGGPLAAVAGESGAVTPAVVSGGVGARGATPLPGTGGAGESLVPLILAIGSAGLGLLLIGRYRDAVEEPPA